MSAFRILLVTMLFFLSTGAFASLSVSHKIDPDWGGGFCYRFTFSNPSNETVRDWSVDFDLSDAEVYTQWNGNFARSGDHYHVTGVSWNNPATPGTNWETGFCANGSGRVKNVQTSQGISPTTNVPVSQTGATTPSPTPQVAENVTITKDGLEVTVRTDSDWGNGYCRKVILRNTLSTTISDWKLGFSLDADIRAWSATWMRSGTSYATLPADWNRKIAPGQSWEIGFCSDSRSRDSLWSIVQVSRESTSAPTNPAPQPPTTPSPNPPPPIIPNPPVTPQPQPTPSTPPATPATGQYSAPFFARSGSLYDSTGKEVALFGVNWFGFETQNYTVHGLWARNYREQILQMKEMGFNAVRLPFCPTTLRSGTQPNSIDYSKNSDLQWLSSLQLFDKIIATFAQEGFYILLDHHRPDCNSISETPEVGGYSLQNWRDDLVFVADRYKGIPNVIGIDLKNEPHGRARWGIGDSSVDWKQQAEDAGAAILAKNPNLLIFVEGVETNGGNCESAQNHWWGGNIEPISCFPISPSKIPVSKLVLSPHVYGPDVYGQPYFSDASFPRNMPTIWEQQIGRFMSDYTVIIGEFGGKYGGKDKIWQDAFIDYLISKKAKQFFFWSWNPNSGDTGGIVKDDWKTIETEKYHNLRRLMDRVSTESTSKSAFVMPGVQSGTNSSTAVQSADGSRSFSSGKVTTRDKRLEHLRALREKRAREKAAREAAVSSWFTPAP